MRKPKCRFLPVSAFLALLLVLPRPGAAVSVGFKLFGGYSSINGGDLNEGLAGYFDFNKAIAGFFGLATSGDYKAFHGGLAVGGDLILYFTPVIGVGIGGGLIDVHSTSKFFYSGTMGSGSITIDPQVKVTPLRAGFHFAVPMGLFVNLTLNGGAEFYLASFKYSVRDEYTPSGWEQTDTTVESNGKIGFFGGLGLEIKVFRNLSFLLEGRGRLARIDGFSGDERETSSSFPPTTDDGDLWYVEIDFGPIGRFPTIALSDTPPPSIPMYQNARSARLSLNGFTIQAGIMIRI